MEDNFVPQQTPNSPFLNQRNKLFSKAFQDTYQRPDYMIKEKKSCPIYTYDEEDKENVSLFKNITPVKNFSHNTSINKSSNNKSQPRSPLSDITRRETGSKKSHSHVVF